MLKSSYDRLSVMKLTSDVPQGKNMSADSIHFADPSFEIGLALLLVAQLLSAWMGVYTQDVYAAHGKHWNENLFYSHAFSLPLFLPLWSTLQGQWMSVQNTPPLPPTSAVYDIPLLQTLFGNVPQGVVFLFGNALTQMACIGGVNLLSAGASAVTVTIVLNIRKLVSFILSIILFGNPLGGQMITGAILVFGSGALYGYETTVRMPAKRRAAEEKAKANGKKAS
jgi:drug/metabolite transporter (DMT)-like permease